MTLPTLATVGHGVPHHCPTCQVGWSERRRRSTCWSCGGPGVAGDVRVAMNGMSGDMQVLDPDGYMALSESRKQAVRAWLEGHGIDVFTVSRVIYRPDAVIVNCYVRDANRAFKVSDGKLESSQQTLRPDGWPL